MRSSAYIIGLAIALLLVVSSMLQVGCSSETGACEYGALSRMCSDDETSDSCADKEMARAFSPGKTCSQLGYTPQSGGQ